MNTNPRATTVLCYGDSNTYGQKPDKTGRYDAGERWTGLLQELLGNDYYIIEEGLGGRITNLEHPRKPARNGKTYLTPCLLSHNPLDIVVIMLGTNDMKIEFNRSTDDVAAALLGLADDVYKNGQANNDNRPIVMLVSPIHIDDQVQGFNTIYEGIYDSESARKSRELAMAIKAVADQHTYLFVDAASVAAAGEDGIHLSAESNTSLAGLLAESIRTITF